MANHASSGAIDVAQALKELTIDEKIKLLSGHKTWTTNSVDRLGIPSLTLSDGPQGVRGTSFFNGPAGCLLPSSTAMGATFDVRLLKEIGELLATEAKERNVQVILAPTVCIPRSPLLGRGFEAFAEDPLLTGILASAYINGVQQTNVGVSIKHYAAHDQSFLSFEDTVRASQRTLREVHLYPFQLAVKHSHPWSVMTAYHRINGLHASENPWLIDQVLRREWGWDGMVVSDWFGTYSTTESINAGLDLEMPGPTRWRGELLAWAILSRKVERSTIDERVRNVLNLINKVKPSMGPADAKRAGDTPEKRDICRRTAANSIVLLKNQRQVLPLSSSVKRTYALIGSAVHNPTTTGGGSSDLKPYYVSTPFEAFTKAVGPDNVKYAIGSYAHIFTPLLTRNITVPGTQDPGYFLEWFDKDPQQDSSLKPVYTTTTMEAQMYFSDNLPPVVPKTYFMRVQTVYTAPKTTTVQIGLCALGKARLHFDGKEVIDLFTSQPEKTLHTPMFNQASMEMVADVAVEAGKSYRITIFLRNESVVPGIGALNAGGLRVGSCEKIDLAQALSDAVRLASEVDVPIVMTGLNADYESEAGDRTSLDLPPGNDKLIEEIIKANPNTVVVIQSGTPIVMPWVESASTLVHAWFGGQETGNAIIDVLFGKVNPSGRLSITFPRRLEDTPTFLTFGKADRELYYGEGVFVGYRYYEKLRNPPLFYFGYGLSYTTFEYSRLAVPETVTLGSEDSFTVSVDVKNVGKCAGAEVVQVYVADKESTVLRPLKELKGFEKVWIEAGATVTVQVQLNRYALSFWDEGKGSWIAEKGTFQIIISKSADPKDEVLRQDFELTEELLWSGV